MPAQEEINSPPKPPLSRLLGGAVGTWLFSMAAGGMLWGLEGWAMGAILGALVGLLGIGTDALNAESRGRRPAGLDSGVFAGIVCGAIWAFNHQDQQGYIKAGIIAVAGMLSGVLGGVLIWVVGGMLNAIRDKQKLKRTSRPKPVEPIVAGQTYLANTKDGPLLVVASYSRDGKTWMCKRLDGEGVITLFDFEMERVANL